jgi:3-isopropylmalate/(R)-2-methylmalate dehydratase small subunit
MSAIEGKCVKLGDNVGVEDMIANRHVKDPQAMKNPGNLKPYFLEAVQPGLGETLGPHCIIVGGRNFGCGSSREHAIRLLQSFGVPAIMAVSFARTFYRNCIDLGIPVLEGGALSRLTGGEDLRINVLSGEVCFGDQVIRLQPVPEFVKEIGQAGGLIPYILGQTVDQ